VSESRGQWFVNNILTTEHFKNTITLILTLTYCWMMTHQHQPSNEFSLLVGMVLGFYFKRGEGSSSEKP